MPTDILDLAREALLRTESPWAQQLRHYQEQKARTDATWAGINERLQFVAQFRCAAPCVPCRWWEEKRDDLEMG